LVDTTEVPHGFWAFVAFRSQVLEVVAPDPEDIDVGVVIDNLPFVPKVAI